MQPTKLHAPILVDEGSPALWAAWAKLLRDNDWSSDDCTVIDLLPELESTKVVFAVDPIDGSFRGCMVWNEYDELAYIGYYLVDPSMKGMGVGPKMWRRAFSRFSKDVKHIGLRSVPEMTAKYMKGDTPNFVSNLYNYELTVDEAREMCDKLETSKGTIVNVDRMTDEQWLELLDFDKEVTRRDRSELLEGFFEHLMVNGVALLNSEGRIIGYAAVAPTGHFDKDQFKLGPVFASSLSDALTMISPLVDACERITPDAKILVKTLTGTVGQRTFSELIDKKPYLEGTTLFQKDFKNTIDTDSCYIPHNHGGHFDA